MNALAVIPQPTAIVLRQQVTTTDEREFRDGFVMPVFEAVPDECDVMVLHDHNLWPIARKGEVVVFERGRFYPVPGGLRVVEYGSNHRHGVPTLHAVQVWPHRGNEEFWNDGPLRPRPDSELAKRFRGFVDGPWPFQAHAERTRGRVLGIYRPRRPQECAQ